MKHLILSTVCMLFCATGLWAQEFIDGIYYNFDKSTLTASVTNRNGGDFPASGSYSGSITIPSTVAYNGTSYIVTSIGYSDDEYGIKYGAFESNYGVTSVTIPNSVTSIVSLAFYDCTGLTSIDVAEDNLNYASIDGVLYSKDKKTLIKCPAGKTSIEIPSSVTSIENYAFDDCTGLTSITIPNSVTSIGEAAFDDCKGLTSINVAEDNLNYASIDGVLYSKDKKTLIICPRGKTGSVTIPNSVTSIERNVFSGLIGLRFNSRVLSACNGLTSITIPNSVTSIYYSAFEGCTGLKEVINKSSLNITKGSAGNGFVAYYADYVYNGGKIAIGDFIFSDQDKTLVKYTGNGGNITLPENFNGGSYTIGASAFSGNTTLTSITISNSVTSIEYGAFYGCTGLKEVINKSSLNMTKGFTSNGYVAYYADYVYNGGKIVIGDFIFSDRDKALIKYTGNGGDIALPEDFNGGNYTIGESVFAGKSNLTSVTIPNSVTGVGSDAFSGCSNIENADINSQSALDAISFTNKLTSIKLGDKITSIASSKFSGCSGLTSITIPNGVTNIGSSAFYNCTGLTSVTIPNSVTSIESQAFYGCSGLTEIICEGETPAGSNTIFGEGGEAGKIYVKALLKVPSQWFKLYKVTEPWCRFDMTASDFDMVVIPYENKAVFTWTPITGAEAYELTVIEKETGEALCSLNFDAYGRLRGLVLRNYSEKTYVGGYDFTVTSLRGDVEYDYTMEVKDISDNVIESMSGTFRTSDGVATAAQEAEEHIVETARYDINGRPLTAPTKGVNIVKYSDGSFKKEFVR